MVDWAILESEILAKNRVVLSGLESRGVSLTEAREIEFLVSLDSLEECKKVRENFRRKYKLPKSGLFVVINEPEDYRLLASAKFLPTPEKITELELQLLECAQEFTHCEVSWEFEE